MTVLEKIKYDGAVGALKAHIATLQFELTNRNWDGIKSNDKYTRMGEAITRAENIIVQMREALTELKQLEPGNK